MSQISIEKFSSLNNNILTKMSESKTINRWKYPITIDPIKSLFDEAYKNPPSCKKHFCAYLKNVHVIGGRVFNESLRTEIEDFFHCGFNPIVRKGHVSVDNAIHLVDKWGGTNYWHWTSMCLARLYLIDNYLHSSMYYIVNSLDKPFVRDSLKVMGIDLSKCIEIDKVNSVFCHNLIAPSRIGDRDKEGVLFLRDQLRNKSAEPTKRIFISRTSNRKFINEHEILSILKKNGFIRVECEKLTFKEQVELFSSAKTVIAPHGAGLTNMIFVPQKTKLLELRSPKYWGSCYWKLCNHLNIEYYSLIGEGSFPKVVGDLSRELKSNIKIDLNKLKQTLYLMGES